MALQDHFDNTALRFLYDMMAEDFPLLVTLFCQDADERLPRLRQALHTGDCAAVASLAHSFQRRGGQYQCHPADQYVATTRRRRPCRSPGRHLCVG